MTKYTLNDPESKVPYSSELALEIIDLAKKSGLTPQVYENTLAHLLGVGQYQRKIDIMDPNNNSIPERIARSYAACLAAETLGLIPDDNVH